jgi:N-succinyldiaminopimelate aminotransferase
MAERTLTISSAGKTFSFTGWKVGWACGPRELVTAARTAKQFLTYTVATPLQHAVAEALALPDDYYRSLADSLRAKRDRLSAGLEAAGLEVFRPSGTYFVNTDVRSIGEEDGVAFCWSLPERAGVAAIPTAVFYADPGARPLARALRVLQARRGDRRGGEPPRRSAVLSQGTGSSRPAERLGAVPRASRSPGPCAAR